jgi:hypothetical protein
MTRRSVQLTRISIRVPPALIPGVPGREDTIGGLSVRDARRHGHAGALEVTGRVTVLTAPVEFLGRIESMTLAGAAGAP